MSDTFGLSSSLRYFEYEFDSQDAIASYSSTVTPTDWPTFQMERPLNNIAGLKVLEVQIPFSFYTITSENQNFTMTAYNFGGNVVSTVTIPAGNYSGATLASTLQTVLNSTATQTYQYYTVTFSSITGKFTFASWLTLAFNTAGLSFYFTFGGANDDGTTNPRLFLGFTGGVTTFAQSFTSANVALVTGPNYLYLCSESLGTLVQLYLPASASLSQGGLGPEMAKIPVNTAPGGVIFWSDPDPNKYFDVESLFSLQQIDLYCTLGTASAQKPLRFNGLGFSVKLGILVNQEARTDTTSSLSKRIRSL